MAQFPWINLIKYINQFQIILLYIVSRLHRGHNFTKNPDEIIWSAFFPIELLFISSCFPSAAKQAGRGVAFPLGKETDNEVT